MASVPPLVTQASLAEQQVYQSGRDARSGAPRSQPCSTVVRPVEYQVLTDPHDRDPLSWAPHDRRLVEPRPSQVVGLTGLHADAPGGLSHAHQPFGQLCAATRVPSSLAFRGAGARESSRASSYSVPSLIDDRSVAGDTDLSTVSRSRSGRSDDRGAVDSDSDSEQSEGQRSNFRWVVESTAKQLALPIPQRVEPVGSGRFAYMPTRELIQLPLAPPSVAAMKAVNGLLVSKKEIAKEAPFPSWHIRAKQQAMFASAPSQELCSAMPVADPHMGLLTRKKSVVWSAALKKQRLVSWQGMGHQLLGQLSMSDHFCRLAQDLVDDSSISGEGDVKVQATLGVLASTLASAQKVAVSLTSHLDLTAREAELRTLDVTQVDETELRYRPLFSGHTFADPSHTSVLEWRHSKRDEALLQMSSKAMAAKPVEKKPAAKPPVSAISSVTLPPQSRSSAPARSQGRGRGRRGRGSRPKSK